jgi:Fe2+ transport system protein B
MNAELDKIISDRAKDLVEKKQTENNSVSDSAPAQIKFDIDHKKSYSEQAKDIVGLNATAKAISDEHLAKDVTDRKKAEILNYADANLKKEEAENKKADIQLQEANYGVHSGVAAYAGIKKPLPQKMQNVLFAILCAVQTILLILFGIPISIINIIADGVDSVVKKLATLTRSAMWIVLACMVGGVGWVVYLIVKSFLANRGINL